MGTDKERLTFWERAGFGCGGFAPVLFWQTIMVYLLFFYTDVFGLAAAAAGTMTAVSRVLDAFFDVGIGITSNQNKMGQVQAVPALDGAPAGDHRRSRFPNDGLLADW